MVFVEGVRRLLRLVSHWTYGSELLLLRHNCNVEPRNIGWKPLPRSRTGYRAQPRVSTLGTLKINEFALKGREADLIKLAPIAAPKIRVRN